MEDEKETETVDEYEKDKQAEERGTSFIQLQPLFRHSKVERTIPCSWAEDLLSDYTFCKRPSSRVELIKQEKSVFTATPCGLHY